MRHNRRISLGNNNKQNKNRKVTMDDVVNIDDVVKLYAHRMFPEEAEGIIEAYEKNKSLFINGSPEEIFLNKKIFDHLPNKKKDN